MIRNENVQVGMVVAIGTDPGVPASAQGRMALVNNITWPAREGRGRRNYQASVILADGTSHVVDVKFLSGIQWEPGLGALADQAINSPENLTEASEPEVVVVTAIEDEGEPVEAEGEPVEVEVVDLIQENVQENKKSKGKRAQA